MVQKRGAAHLEMVISFVFFVTFVSFLFIVLKPYETTALTGNVVTSIEESFVDEVQTNFSRFFLKVDDAGPPRTCFNLTLPSGGFKHAITESQVIDLTNSRAENSSIQNRELSINGDTARSFSVLVSPEFEDSSSATGCNILTSDNYTLGSIFEKKVISFKKLETMKSQYDSSYESLKMNLKIPEVFDFAIRSEELPQINMLRSIPSAANVVVSERVYEVIQDSGSIKNVRIIFSIW